MNTPQPTGEGPRNGGSRRHRAVVGALLAGSACLAVLSAFGTPGDGGADLEAEKRAQDAYVARFREAQRLMGRGADQEAENLLRELIVERPEEASVHHALGLLLQFRKRPEDAATELLIAARMNPKEAVIQRDAGLHLANLGRVAEAETFLAAASALWPEDVETAVGHGAALRALGNVSAATTAYRRAVAADANSVDAAVGLAACIVDDDPAGALRLVAPATGQWPDVLLVRGMALERLERYDEALPILVKVLDVAPPGRAGLGYFRDAAESLILCGETAAAAAAAARWAALETSGGALSDRAAFCLAQTHEARGDHEAALAALAQGPPLEEAAPDRRAHTKLFRAAVLLRAGRAADARPLLESLTEFAKNRFERMAALRLLGRISAEEFEPCSSQPGRANDVHWIESLAAAAAGDPATATAARARAAAASKPRGEYPGLLVR